MIQITDTLVPSSGEWETAIRGMRNPLNSWGRTDSKFGVFEVELGENDLKLMTNLGSEGTCCRKYMRMLTVSMDILAPLYWWKEFDTYKIGTVANSCSTMHKIHSNEFERDDFSHDHLIDEEDCKWGDTVSVRVLDYMINTLNHFRRLYLDTKDKKYWWQLIQLLPSSYNQKRTVMLNYETLAQIYKWRKNHKLDEWRAFCDWIEKLPYADELICRKEESHEPDSNG